MALVLKDGEKAGDKPKASPAPTAPAAAEAEAPTSRPAISSGRPLTPRARAAALRAGGGGAASGGNINAGIRVKSSPLARKIADARGVRLDAVKGTGPGGRIIAFDVESAPVGSPAPAAGSSSVAAILPTPIAGMPETRVPLSGMRRVIAERLLASKTQIPHFYLSIEIDAAPMMAFRKEYIAASGGKITFTVKAFALLRRVFDGFTTEKGVKEYLILLSVCQSCKYMGVDFLDFLRSGEKDIHAFAESRRRGGMKGGTLAGRALP